MAKHHTLRVSCSARLQKEKKGDSLIIIIDRSYSVDEQGTLIGLQGSYLAVDDTILNVLPQLHELLPLQNKQTKDTQISAVELRLLRAYYTHIIGVLVLLTQFPSVLDNCLQMR